MRAAPDRSRGRGSSPAHDARLRPHRLNLNLANLQHTRQNAAYQAVITPTVLVAHDDGLRVNSVAQQLGKSLEILDKARRLPSQQGVG